MHPHRGVQPRARAGAAAHPAAPLVPQHLGLGRRAAAASRTIALGPAGAGFRQPAWPTTRTAEPLAEPPVRLPARAALPLRRGRRRAAVHRQRDERAARVRAAAPQPQPLRQGRLPPPRHRRRSRAVNPDQVGTKAALHYRVRCVPAGRLGRRSACGFDRRALDDAAGRRRRDRSPSARPRPTSSTTAIHPPKADRRRAAGPAPGARRPALDQADLPLRRRPLARRRQPRLAAAGVAQADPQRALAAPELDARDVDAGQVGVSLVRRLGPGLPLRRRSRWSTRSSPRSSSGCCSSSSSSTPTARSRPTSGSSPT